MKSSKVTIGLFLLLLAILSSCAGTEDAPADSIYSDALTAKQYQKLIHDMHENGEIFDEEDLERLAELESVMHELHNGTLAELEEHMEELQHTHLADLEERMELLEPFISAEIEEHMEHMHEVLGDIDINVPIPPIPPIPPIAHLPHLPDIDGSFFIHSNRPFSVGGRFYGPASESELKRLFPGIEEEEILKLQAMASLTRQSAQTAVPTLSKVAKSGKTPAQRYQAVSLLAHYMKKDKSIVPLLGEVAFDDNNINVRKRAVLILGKCGDDRAIPIIENLIKKGSE